MVVVTAALARQVGSSRVSSKALAPCDFLWFAFAAVVTNTPTIVERRDRRRRPDDAQRHLATALRTNRYPCIEQLSPREQQERSVLCCVLIASVVLWSTAARPILLRHCDITSTASYVTVPVRRWRLLQAAIAARGSALAFIIAVHGYRSTRLCYI